jgi:hypothetical protein
MIVGLTVAAASACQERPAAAPSALEQVTTIADAADRPFGLFGSTLYVSSSDAEVSVRAYRMPDGAPQWSATLPVPARQVTVREAGQGLVLVNADRTALALDAATGALRWRSEGAVLGWAVGGASVVTLDPDADPMTLTGWRTSDGARLWTETVGAGDEYGLGYGAAGHGAGGRGIDSVAVVGRADGATRIRDAATGDLTEGRVRPPGDGGRVAVVDDLLLVSSVDGALGATAGYDTRGLNRRWAVDGAFHRAAGCGPVLCLGGNGVRAVDPATGADRWANVDIAFATPALPGRDPGPLLSDRDPTGATGPVVLNADTGVEIMRLGPWSVLGPDTPRLMLIRHAGSTGPDRIAVADLDQATVRELGTVPAVTPTCAERDTTSPGCPRPPGVPSQCRPGLGWLVCSHVDGDLRVWRYGR